MSDKSVMDEVSRSLPMLVVLLVCIDLFWDLNEKIRVFRRFYYDDFLIKKYYYSSKSC